MMFSTNAVTATSDSPPISTNSTTSQTGQNAGDEAAAYKDILNNESLSQARSNIPLLQAYEGDTWLGIKPREWVSKLNDLFIMEKMHNDAEKLATYPRYVHPKKGSARFIIDTIPEIKEAKTWEEFTKALLAFLGLATTESSFELFCRFKSLSWSNTVLPVFVTQLTKALEEFAWSAEYLYGVILSEKLKRILIFATVWSEAPSQFSGKIAEYFDINKTVSEQARIYLNKIPDLMFPFKTNKSNPQQPGFKTSNRSSNRCRRPLSRSRIDPSTTPSCNNCERWGHHINNCKYSPFCSLCHEYHQRGCTQNCLFTSWEKFSSHSLQRIKFVSPERGSRPSNKGNRSTNRSKSWRRKDVAHNQQHHSYRNPQCTYNPHPRTLISYPTNRRQHMESEGETVLPPISPQRSQYISVSDPDFTDHNIDLGFEHLSLRSSSPYSFISDMPHATNSQTSFYE